MEFHQQIINDVLEDDGLVVLGRGLGLNTVLLHLIKIFCDPSALVICLNTSPSEEEHFFNCLRLMGVQSLPKKITTKYNAEERAEIYLQGGVFFVSSRILIVDLLTTRIPGHLITGFIVNSAHKVTSESTEAFILRLFRKSNKTGFIRGFSDYPEAFTTGFCKVEKVMRNLYATRLHLWPRFHVTVSESLAHQPEVIELHQPVSKSMLSIQSAIVKVMDACLDELKESNKLDITDLTVETGLFRYFDRLVMNQLEPVWHTVDPVTKQLVADLGTLRQILHCLVEYDCVTYNRFLETLREHHFGEYSAWVFLDEADIIFKTAKERVYVTNNQAKRVKKKKTTTTTTTTTNADKDHKYELVLEENPKWGLLVEVLEEVKEDLQSSDCVLVMVQNERTCVQLQEYLELGGQGMLAKKFKEDFIKHRTQGSPVVSAWSSRGNTRWRRGSRYRGRGKFARGTKRRGASRRASRFATTRSAPMALGEFLANTKRSSIPSVPVKWTRSENRFGVECEDPGSEFINHFGVLSDPKVVIHPYTDARVLHTYRPKVIVIYDPDTAFIRQIEVFNGENPKHKMRVYFMVYENSVEEQKYLSGLRKEKEAFQMLIRERASMVIPEGQDGKSSESLELGLDSPDDPRLSLGMISQDRGQVLVDHREFRCALPSYLHGRGFEIVPCHLEVGDYILSPDICVERKSISDLFGSFQSGRLYTQVKSMTRHFKIVVLLIEFDREKSFSLQSPKTLTSDISQSNIVSKLVLLTIHFPALRFLWSRSPKTTAEIFEKLKQGKGEPKVEIIGTGTLEMENAEALAPQDMLRRLPGVTDANFTKIVEAVPNLHALSHLPQKKLKQLLGPKNGSLLYNFFNESN